MIYNSINGFSFPKAAVTNKNTVYAKNGLRTLSWDGVALTTKGILLGAETLTISAN